MTGFDQFFALLKLTSNTNRKSFALCRREDLCLVLYIADSPIHWFLTAKSFLGYL